MIVESTGRLGAGPRHAPRRTGDCRFVFTGDVRLHRASLAELRSRWQTPDVLELLGWQEREVLQRMHSPRRREHWLYGRLLAKEAIREAMDLRTAHEAPDDLRRIDVCSADGLGRGMRPVVSLDGRAMPIALSIAHSDAGVAVAVATRPGLTPGVDLVSASSINDSVIDAWLSEAEREWAFVSNPFETRRRVAVAWGAKEAGYKASHLGEGFLPSRYEVRRIEDGRLAVHVTAPSGERQVQIELIQDQDETIVIALVDSEKESDA